MALRLVPIALLSVAICACGEAARPPTPLPDPPPGGTQDPPPTTDAGVDAGSNDVILTGVLAHAPANTSCTPGESTVADGGLVWGPGPTASVAAAQANGWTRLSEDPDCAALLPQADARRFSYTAPPDCFAQPDGGATCVSFCQDPVVDGKGDLAVITFPAISVLPSDGTQGDAVLTGMKELPLSVAPGPSGFALLSAAFGPTRSFARALGPDGSISAASCSEIPGGEPVQTSAANPLGGYVEGMTTFDSFKADTLWLRWVDDTLRPTGHWHPVVTWRGTNLNHSWALYVDQQGKALVLSFFYLPGFGAPAAPSTWTFSAQWMGPDGPLGDRFEPPHPTYTPPPSGPPFALFAGFGSAVPLPGGGFAMFHDGEVGSAGGSISPKGWYAAYSSTAGLVPAPDWVTPYDGSMHLLAGARGYEATRRDPVTCARSALLVSPTGTLCFTLPLEGSDFCTFGADVIAADGTVALRNGCEFRWWPGLARPAP